MYRSRGSVGVTQLLAYKKKKTQQKQIYFRDEQALIPLQRIYFEINKFNKYISNEISVDIAQRLLCIVEAKTKTLNVTPKKYGKKI